jgi:hypothetical protein
MVVDNAGDEEILHENQESIDGLVKYLPEKEVGLILFTAHNEGEA